jgi:sigma-54 dependent transcriptional regulator, acetoin dehydrogenase operon transcriptional activator AcoR
MDRALRTRAVRPPDAALGLPAAAQASQFRLIEHSHQRCEALGLSRIERPDPAPLMRSDIAVARERNQRLFTHAAPVMEMLFEQIAGTESMIVLTDAQGTILHSVGDDDFLDRAGKVALTPGVSWAEHSKGTNAIGTALFEEAPTLVHASQHFMHANNFLTCSAAPIFDPRGNMLGVLDVSGDQRSYHQHTMGLVRVSARMIENHWLSDDCNNRLRLHFHSRAEFIGTLLEGILLVSPEGRIVGSNRSALDQLALLSAPRTPPCGARPPRGSRKVAKPHFLESPPVASLLPQGDSGLGRPSAGMSAAALRMHSLTSLLGTSMSAVMDHLRAPQHVPLMLNLPNGQPLYVTARFNAMPRPVFSERFVQDDAPAEAPPPVQADAAQPAAAHEAAHDATHQSGGLRQLQTGDPQVDALVGKIRRVLNRDIPMLILGETGTGKEMLARAIHHDSHRARRPFVVVNCAAIPESLIEAELFGCEEGAFTGARRQGAPGSIVQANGGTLLLDDIGDMPVALQARLLQVLQERQVKPLGGQRSVAVDIAVIGATRRNLREMSDAHQFRDDLYYRLNGLSVRLPALRERGDLAAVAQRILRSECPNGAPEISAPVMELFRRCTWPGNIRQLANVLRIAAVMAGDEGPITEAHLPDDFLDEVRGAAATAAAAEPAAMLEIPPRPAPARTMKDAERETIREALAAANGNISAASKRLGICRNTVYRKLFWNENK